MKSQTTDTPPLHCDGCGEVSKSSRLPRGWHRDPDDNPLCKPCWDRRYVLRAVSLPVVRSEGETTDQLWTACRECWRNATSLANWAVSELAKADIVRTPDMKKLPTMPRLYLYPEARKVIPDMDSTSVTAMLTAVERRYRKERYEVLWLRNRSLPNYREPTPYPVHNQSWKPVKHDDGPAVSVRMGGARRTLILRSGGGWFRQMAQFAHLLEGRAIKGELSVLQKTATVNGRQIPQLWIKMVAWLPRPATKERKGTLVVRTAADCFLRAETGWTINGDSIRSKILAYETWMQRAREDLKHEKRWPRSKRDQMQRDVRARTRKQHDRLNSFLHEISALLAKYAARRNVARVTYDDTIRDYLPSFPWFRLAELVQYKMDEVGIEFATVAKSSVPGNSPSPVEIS